MLRTPNKLSLRDGRVVVSSRNAGQRQGVYGSVRSRVQANLDYSGLVGGNAGGASSQFAVQNNSLDPFLQGFVNTDDMPLLRRIYKDIYDNDPICGGTIDLMSELPFSNFTLTGVDKKIIDKYQESLDRLQVTRLLPEITAEYLTFGEFCGSLIWQQRQKVFTDIMPHDLNNITIMEMPFNSMEPIITVRNDERVKEFLRSENPEVERLRRGINSKLLEAMQADSYELDPLTAVYLQRRSLMKRGSISLLRRVLPIYFLEKQLFRGTLIEASKRLRAIGHLMIGNERWTPTDEEMEEYLEFFQMADQDPLGALVVTREGVQYSDLRQGGDFWKITDIVDQTSTMKLRAMGTSEAFLSGDVNYDTAEVALSVFMDRTKSFRDAMTLRFLTMKVFPVVAITNGFIKQRRSETANGDLQRRTQFEINNLNNFEIPTVQWHKQLTADPNNSALDNLDRLADMGVPPTLRAVLAAGGISLEAWLRDVEDEKPLLDELEQKGYDVSRFRMGGGSMGGGGGGGRNLDGLDGFGNPATDGPGDDPGFDQNFDDLKRGDTGRPSAIPGGPVDQSSVRTILSQFRMKGFMDRDWRSVAQEPYTITKTGKMKSVPFPHRREREINDTIKNAVIANRDPATYERNVRRGRLSNLGGLPYEDEGRKR